jgi:hypothetical protein
MCHTHDEVTGYLQVHAICNQGKHLECGQTQHAATWRHKDPLKCPVSMLAWLLFWRFEQTHEEFPDYTVRRRWFFRHILPAEKDRNKGISDSHYAGAIIDAYHLVGIPLPRIALLKKRHTGRKFGARFLQRRGVSREDIGAHGGWSDGKIYNFVYLFQVDETAKQVGAGFDIKMRKENITYPRTDLWDRELREKWASTILPDCMVWDKRLRAPVEEHPELWSIPGGDKCRNSAFRFNSLLVCPPATPTPTQPQPPQQPHPSSLQQPHPPYLTFLLTPYLTFLLTDLPSGRPIHHAAPATSSSRPILSAAPFLPRQPASYSRPILPAVLHSDSSTHVVNRCSCATFCSKTPRGLWRLSPTIPCGTTTRSVTKSSSMTARESRNLPLETPTQPTRRLQTECFWLERNGK